VESTRKATVHPNLESIPSSYIANDLGMKLFKDAAYVNMDVSCHHNVQHKYIITESWSRSLEERT
jgi:hypothetical protein